MARWIRIHASIRGFLVDDRGFEYRNRLLKNFYSLLYGILAYQNVVLVPRHGDPYTARVTGNLTCRYSGKPDVPVVMHRCTDTETIPFNSYTCDVLGSDDVPYDRIFQVSLGDRECVEAMTTSNYDCNSTTISPCFYGTDGGVYTTLLNHVVAPISVGRITEVRICFYEPWLKNFARIWTAILCDCNNFDAIDVNGTSFYIRGSDQIFGGKVKLLLGVGTSPFSFDNYALESPKEIDYKIYNHISDTYADIRIVSYYTPEQDETVYEVGLVLPIYDTNGNLHDVLILRHVNPDGYKLTGGQVNIIEILIYGE